MVGRVEQLDVFSPCPSVRGHSVCTNSVSRAVPPASSADFQEFGRSAMESLEPGHGLGIVGQSDVDSSYNDAHEHSVCTVSAGSRELGKPAVLPVFSEASRRSGRSVMESARDAEPMSHFCLTIIDTTCLFCVAGSHWWTNYKKLAGRRLA